MRKRRLPYIFLIGGVVVALFIAYAALAFPSAHFDPGPNADEVTLDASLVIRFSKPVNRRSLQPAITPDLGGEWQYEDPIIGTRHLFAELRFIPETTLLPNTTYTVTLRGVTDIFTVGPERQFSGSFTTRALPTVASVDPQGGATGVKSTAAITVALTSPNADVAAFDFSLTPAVEFSTSLNEARDRYTLTPAAPLAQGTPYELVIMRSATVREVATNEIVARGESEEVFRGSFATVPPAQVLNIAPTGDHVPRDTPVIVTFTTPVSEEQLRSRLTITPTIASTLSLSEDQRTVTITLTEGLAYETLYEVRIPAGTEDTSGGSLPEDVVFDFLTIGAVRLARSSPADGNAGVGIKSPVRVTFDQEVDHASAEGAFRIEPSVEGALSWDGTTLSFTPKNPFAFQTTYRATVAPGVKSVRGLDSREAFTFSFTTVAETVKLPIPNDLQDHALSCEAAALKMALAGKGVRVTESDIMARVGYDRTPHRGDVWGDPYLAFVGDINGRQNTTGYGVYGDPIAKAANGWRPAEAFTGWTSAQIAKEIAAGNPVIVWGVYGNGYEDSWHTPAGKAIYAWKGEHTRTVIGFVGSPEDPQKFILNDPYVGQITWTRARFEQDFRIFGNAGVVVR